MGKRLLHTVPQASVMIPVSPHTLLLHSGSSVTHLTTVVTPHTTPSNAARIVQRLRQLGMQRAFFGTDLSIYGNPPRAELWQTLLAKLPLTPAEQDTSRHNIPPHLTQP